MAVTTTTTTSWGSRLGNSIKGVLVGLALFVLGFPLLFWNEGNTVKTRKALEEGEGACVHVESPAEINPEYEGRLVHMSGRADTQDVLSDGQFGVSETAIKLVRKVEMYQWQEDSSTTKKKNLGGSETTTTTYTHRKVWSSAVLPSPSHPEPGQDMTNPGAMEFESGALQAETVAFGAFRLSAEQISSIGEARPYVFPTNWVCPVAKCVKSGAMVYVPNAATREGGESNVIRNVMSAPAIGDMRVSFEIVLPHDISLVAKQYGDTFTGYVAKNGKRVQLLSDGIKDQSEMFAAAQSANTMMCWILRLAGFGMMFIGLSMLFKPLSVLGDVVPFIGTVIGIGTGIVAFVIALVCALVTIAVAWLFYRPLVGISLLVAAGALIYWLKTRKKALAAPAASSAPASGAQTPAAEA